MVRLPVFYGEQHDSVFRFQDKECISPTEKEILLTYTVELTREVLNMQVLL